MDILRANRCTFSLQHGAGASVLAPFTELGAYPAALSLRNHGSVSESDLQLSVCQLNFESWRIKLHC